MRSREIRWIVEPTDAVPRRVARDHRARQLEKRAHHVARRVERGESARATAAQLADENRLHVIVARVRCRDYCALARRDAAEKTPARGAPRGFVRGEWPGSRRGAADRAKPELGAA